MTPISKDFRFCKDYQQRDFFHINDFHGFVKCFRFSNGPISWSCLFCQEKLTQCMSKFQYGKIWKMIIFVTYNIFVSFDAQCRIERVINYPIILWLEMQESSIHRVKIYNLTWSFDKAIRLKLLFSNFTCRCFWGGPRARFARILQCAWTGKMTYRKDY